MKLKFDPEKKLTEINLYAMKMFLKLLLFSFTTGNNKTSFELLKVEVLNSVVEDLQHFELIKQLATVFDLQQSSSAVKDTFNFPLLLHSILLSA